MLRLLGSVFGSAALGIIAMCRRLSAPRYRGPVSDHFDGRRFYNSPDTWSPSFGDFLEWMRTRQPKRWHRASARPASPPPVDRVGRGRMRVTFIGHATVLLQMDGLNILTDPIWSERASPVRFAGPRRVHPPGLRFEDLPHIDLVLVSHNHYDHLDLPTLRRLERAHRPRFLLPLGNAAILERAGIAGGEDLDWWQGLEVAEGVRVTLVPSRHFSSRSLCDAWRTLWGSFVVQGPSGAAFFAGDTGFGGHFEEIARRFAPFRLAILPIGAYEPRWFMAPMHMSPADSVRAATILRAAVAVGIHHATFRLSDEGQTQASRDLDEAMGGTDPRMRFWHLDFGEARDVPESDAAFEVRFETP